MKITTNKNKKLVSDIRAKLRENGGYCPCKMTHSPETKCMCREFRDQMERGETGECHCGLYVIQNT